jgi:integrase
MRMWGKEAFQLYQRKGSSNWWVRFSIPGEGQIRKSLATADEQEAHRRAAKVWHQAIYRHENGLRPVQRSFATVAEEFIEHMHRLSSQGEKRFDRGQRIEPLVRRYFIRYFDNKPIDAITDADVTRYQEWRKSYWLTGPGKDQTHLEYQRKGVRLRRPVTDMRRVPSLSTQRSEAVVLRQLFRQAAKWGYINNSQLPDVQTQRVPPSPRPSFSADEMKRLTDLALARLSEAKISDHVRRDRTILYAYISIAVNTGMRPAELKNLNWGDVLWYRENRTKPIGQRDIRIRARGKGRSREFIPHEGALAAFDVLWMLWDRDHDAPPADTDPVFASPDGKRLTSLKTGLKSLLDAAGLKADHRGVKRDSYSFRHFYISQQLIAGVDVFALARNTGTSPDMIDKFYGQVSVEQLKDALRPTWHRA